MHVGCGKIDVDTAIHAVLGLEARKDAVGLAPSVVDRKEGCASSEVQVCASARRFQGASIAGQLGGQFQETRPSKANAADVTSPLETTI